jgi:hypothetical protein
VGSHSLYTGKHYTVKATTVLPPPPPVQQPRIPIWIVGAWPRMKSMRRVWRYDGLLPAVLGDDGAPTSDDVRAMKEFIAAQRIETTAFDILMEGEAPRNDHEQAAAIVRPWADAGVTWWIEAMWSEGG